MKKFSLMIAVLLILTLAVGVLAACNNNEDNNTPGPEDEEITVTFDMLGEGEDVVVKGKAGDALQAPVMHDTEGYYFGGWHLKSDLSDDAATPTVFPEADAIYHAEWYVTYTFKAMFEQQDGSFLHDAAHDKSGKAIKGEQNAVSKSASEFDAVEGYTLAETSYTLQLVDGEKDAELEVKYFIGSLTVTYVTGIGDDIVSSKKYGGTVDDEDILPAYEHRRFVGWAESDGGEAAYFGGETLERTGEFTLYAVWEVGIGDVLGGSDYVYISKTESGVVYLERYGRDDYLTGTLAGKIFSVKVNDAFTLDGMLLDDGFYYFKDTVEHTYKNVADASETLELVQKGKGKAVLHGSEGNVEGTYSLDPRTSVYEFTPATGEGFFFRLVQNGEELCFAKADEVKGNYISRYAVQTSSGVMQTWLILEFDGFGNAIEHHDPNGGDTEYEGAIGSYEWDDKTEAYIITLYGSDPIIARIAEDEKGATEGGYELSGSILERDGLEGEYYSNIEGQQIKDTQSGVKLTLDGFGEGTYLDAPIKYTYEIEYYWFEENPYDEDYYGVAYIYWVTFEHQDKTYTVCIEQSIANTGDFYVEVEENSEFDMELFSDIYGLSGIYDGNSFEVTENTLGVFMYKYGKADGAMVTVYSAYQGSLTGQVVFTELDWGVVEEESELTSTYKFTSTYDYFNDKHDITFQFKYSAEGEIIPQTYKKELIVNGDKDNTIVIDKFGYMYFSSDALGMHSEPIKYAFDGGFNVSFLICYLPSSAVGLTTAQAYYVYFDENDEIDRFELAEGYHMITDTLYGNAIVTVPRKGETGKYDGYIAVTQGDGSFYFVLGGEATYLEGATDGSVGAKYSFEIDPDTIEETTEFLQSQGDEVYEMMARYYSFKYEITSSQFGECKLLYDRSEIENSKGDKISFNEDGSATIERNGAQETATSYHYLTEDVIEMFVYKGDTRYNRYITVTLDGEGNITDFSIGGDEANIYYLESEITSGLEIFSRYFIFLGDGAGIMASSSGDLALYVDYEPTELTFELNGTSYTEYKISVYNDSLDDIPDLTYIIAVATEDFNLEDGTKWHGGKFIARSYGYGEFEFVGGGSVSGNGYTHATYVDADGNSYEAALYFVIIEDQYLNASLELESSDEPTGHIYIAYYGEDGNIIDRLLFDEGEDGKYELRDGYSGKYAEVNNNSPSARDVKTMYLDGHGNAILYDENDTPIENGKYRPAPELGDGSLIYTSDDDESEVMTFVFGLYRMDGINCYILYIETHKGAYLGESGELLVNDGFSQSVYVDKYGVVTSGLGTYLTANLLEFTPYGASESILFELDLEEHTFARGTLTDWIIEGDVLIRYNGSETDIEIPETVRTIGEKAFLRGKLTSVSLKNVTRIEAEAFELCESLTSIDAPNVTYIGLYAFAGCDLTEVTLPKVETIEDGAFRDCPIANVKLNKIARIGQYAFSRESSWGTTEFDLTECDTLAELEAADEAFYATIDDSLSFSPINMKVYVKDIEALNVIISSTKVGTVLKNTSGLRLAEEDDLMKGAVYVGFTNRSVYVFDGGTLVMRQGASSAIFGVYVKSETSGVDIYVRTDSGYVKSLESVTGGNILSLQDEILFKNKVEHTVKTSDNKYTVKFTLGAEANASFGSISVTATLDGEDALSAILSADNGTLRLAIGQDNTKYYDVRITGERNCEVSELGNMINIATEDKLYQIAGFVKDGKITELLSFGYHAGDSVDPNNEGATVPTYSNRTISNLVIDESGKATFDWWYYTDEFVTLEVRYIEQSNAIEATPIMWTINVVRPGGNGTCNMTVGFDLEELRVDPNSITFFAYTSKTGIFAEPVEEKIISVTEREYHEDESQFGEPAGVTELEIVTENGKYIVTIKAVRNPQSGDRLTTYSVESASSTIEKVNEEA